MNVVRLCLRLSKVEERKEGRGEWSGKYNLLKLPQVVEGKRKRGRWVGRIKIRKLPSSSSLASPVKPLPPAALPPLPTALASSS